MYKIESGSGVIVCEDGYRIAPPYEDIRYFEYAEWVTAGNAPIQIDQVIDTTVTTYQAKAALALVGRFDEVEAYMNLESTDRLTKLKWEYSNFKRSDPSVQQIANALGMTDQELDYLFALAATIE